MICRVAVAVLLLACAPALKAVAVSSRQVTAPVTLRSAPIQDAADPDLLYADRETPASARAAIAIWEARLGASAADLESGWKLARALYWMGTSGPGTRDEKKQLLGRGIEAARNVIAAAPRRPEGHFWLAANMGALAESYGLVQGIRYRGAIRDALETVLEIDPGYLQGSADRALGRWYDRVPRLFGGNKQRSVEHLEKALAYNPNSIITRLFLAETLIDLGRLDEARMHLVVAIDAPADPDWAPEDRRFRAQALARLESLPESPAGR